MGVAVSVNRLAQQLPECLFTVQPRGPLSCLPGSDLLSGYTLADPVSRTYETNRNRTATVENRFDENLISQFDYANDSLASRTRRFDNLTVTNDLGYNVRSEVIGALMARTRTSPL